VGCVQVKGSEDETVTGEEDTEVAVPAQQQGCEIPKVDLANRYTARI